MLRYTLTFCLLCLCMAWLCPTELWAQEGSKPKITNIPGGFFAEWNAPTDVAALQFDKKLTGPFEIMFDVPSVDFLKEMLDKYSSHTASPEMITVLADYWMLRGKHERAMRLYEESLKQDNLDESKAWVFQNNLALLYSRALGQHDRALEIVNSALDAKKDNVVLLNTKGLILLNSGNPTEAIPVLQQAVELSCQNPLYCMHLAYASHLAGQTGRARRWLDPVRAQLNEFLPSMGKENKTMYDLLQLAFPSVNE